MYAARAHLKKGALRSHCYGVRVQYCVTGQGTLTLRHRNVRYLAISVAQKRFHFEMFTKVTKLTICCCCRIKHLKGKVGKFPPPLLFPPPTPPHPRHTHTLHTYTHTHTRARARTHTSTCSTDVQFLLQNGRHLPPALPAVVSQTSVFPVCVTHDKGDRTLRRQWAGGFCVPLHSSLTHVARLLHLRRYPGGCSQRLPEADQRHQRRPFIVVHGGRPHVQLWNLAL